MFESEVQIILPWLLVSIFFIVFSTLHATEYNKKDNKLIYILIWTSPGWAPFDVVPWDQKSFENCTYNNCFFTVHHNYFQNVIDYDVILFNVVQVALASVLFDVALEIPANRSEKQLYCMFAMEPARFHIISDMWNGFFNMTFTFKFSSNVSIPFIVVKDHNNNPIGPKAEMYWIQLSDMNETNQYVKKKLQNKIIAAAWLVSHCDYTPWRFMYANDLQKELAKYGHRVDVYGKCSNMSCTIEQDGSQNGGCFAAIESDYYFYLAFENSFGEDYVTEKILNGLEHFSVPVVFGGGDFHRFMPEGIYLDANVLAPDALAKKMVEIINDKDKYYDFFRWHDHYSFHSSSEDLFSREICNLCAFLNNNINKTNIMDDIAAWWNVVYPNFPPVVEKKQYNAEEIFTDILNFLDPLPD